MRMRPVLFALVLAAAACGTGAEGARATTILVDYSHDEFASVFIKNFPARVSARAGDELVFRQTWTGEPHTITGGTLIDGIMRVAQPYLDRLEELEEFPPDLEKAEGDVPFAFDDEGTLNQTTAQPCYLDAGKPAKDGKPCPPKPQPAFNGRQTFYNSGVVRYDGPGGNEYRVKLADEIAPGTYFFYCLVHGESQYTELDVKAADEDVPPASTVNRRARDEIQKMAAPLLDTFRDASEDNRVRIGDETVTGPFAGLLNPDVPLAMINEFVPREMSAKAGDKVRWSIVGDHTISFNVPRYFPIVEFLEDGTVRRNPKLDPPAGGAPAMPEHQGAGPLRMDAGTWDGEGFWSSGVIGTDPYIDYSLTITKPGRYKYACLIHPPMVGTLEIT